MAVLNARKDGYFIMKNKTDYGDYVNQSLDRWLGVKIAGYRLEFIEKTYDQYFLHDHSCGSSWKGFVSYIRNKTKIDLSDADKQNTLTIEEMFLIAKTVGLELKIDFEETRN